MIEKDIVLLEKKFYKGNFSLIKKPKNRIFAVPRGGAGFIKRPRSAREATWHCFPAQAGRRGEMTYTGYW